MEITIYGITFLGKLIRYRAVRRLRFARVAGARQDWQARIFWEVGIGRRELAHQESRAAVGKYRTAVAAVGAQSGFGVFRRIAHETRIAQSRA